MNKENTTNRLLATGCWLLVLIFAINFISAADDFSTDSILIKSSVRQGELLTKSINIQNNLDKSQNFNVKVTGLLGLAFLDINDYVIASNGNEDIELQFKNTTIFRPGVYVGKMAIESSKSSEEIPIVIEIQSENIVYAISSEISPVYDQVEPGAKALASVRILNMDLERHEIELKYSIKDLASKIIASATEKIEVEREVVLSKSLTIPNYVKEGQYIFIIEVLYKDSVSTTSNFFRVEKKGFLEMDLTNLFVIFAFCVLVLIYIMFRARNNLILELKRQHVEELRVMHGKIKSKEIMEIEKAKTPQKRNRIRKQYKLAKENATIALKERQNEQKTQLSNIRSSKEQTTKMKKWKTQGFNTKELDTIITKSKPSLNDLKDKGYDVSVLE